MFGNLKDNKTKRQRRQQEEMFKKQQSDLDTKRNREAAQVFNEKAGLKDAIIATLFPAIVVIETSCGRIGMGFFQHERWLVSNAHVIKHRLDIENEVMLKSFSSSTILEAEQAYHRPWDSVTSPDIVVIKTNQHYSNLPSTQLSLDETHPEILYFYIDANFDIHFLSLVSAPNTIPLQFRCNNGQTPQAGCSGTPVFSAQVVLGRTPTWKFNTVGALYARSNDSTLMPTSHAQKLVCAVPIIQEFEQIRQILISLDSSERHSILADSSTVLNDQQRAENSKKLAAQEAYLAQNRLMKFEAGDSILEIDLPDGLEKLAGSSFVNLTQSLLKLSQQEIFSTFHVFIEYIRDQKCISIKVNTETTILKQDYWRLDCKPGTSGKFWVLQLQDNTGKGVKVPGSNKSASSIFAEVKVPIEIEYIKGQALAKDLLQSQNIVVQKQTLEEQAKKISGHQKKQLLQSADNLSASIIIDAINGSTSQEYRTSPEEETSRPATPRTLTLFSAIMETSNKDFAKVIKEVQNNDGVDRINAIDENGNTPLMILLQDHDLHLKEKQISKIYLLMQYGALLTQKNKAGKTAEQLLEEHPNKEELRL